MTKLEYFKSKILNHLHSLEENENQEVSKSMYVNFLCKTMTDPIYMAKANYGVGHISTYKDGSIWKKVQSNPPKWRCVRQGKNYTQENKGAKIALSRLISKVEKATSTDELLEVVMFNIDRFRDEKGNVLDFVKELKKHVESKKQGLNKRVKKEKSTLGFTSETEQTPNAAASNTDNSSITDDGKKSRERKQWSKKDIIESTRDKLEFTTKYHNYICY